MPVITETNRPTKVSMPIGTAHSRAGRKVGAGGTVISAMARTMTKQARHADAEEGQRHVGHAAATLRLQPQGHQREQASRQQAGQQHP